MFARSPSSRDSNPLLPLHHDQERTTSFDLQDLSPHPSQTASPSPPPSFYRAKNSASNNLNTDGASPYHDDDEDGRPFQLSPSPERTQKRRIQFAAPPPPITSSVLFHGRKPAEKSPKWGRETGSGGALRSPPAVVREGMDPLVILGRKEGAIQRELQELLDAQSAGLVQGFGGERKGSVDGSEGSATPTSRSGLGERRSGSRGGNGKGVVPVRQPKKKVVGLRSARRGLLRDMGELVGVKDEESGILDVEIERRDKVLLKVEVWEKRIEGARQQLSGAASGENEDAGELVGVKDEESGILDVEIERRDKVLLKVEVWEKRIEGARQQLSGAASGENEDAGEVARELEGLRTEEQAMDAEIREMEDRLAQMKAKKRWVGERISEAVNRQEARLSSYRGALREAESEVKQFLKRPPVTVSAIMGEEQGFMALPTNRRTLGMAKEWWNKEITQLKTRKEEVEKEKVALEEGAQLWQDSIQVVTEFEDDLRKQMAGTPDPSMLQTQIDKMAPVIGKLSEAVKTAEERGWNLLICAIGAELAAFKEGEEMWRGVLKTISGVVSEKHDEIGRREVEDALDSEDEGPSPELLVEAGH
ncbi:hypothetical protein HYFRA_00004015 [Hymenoscyphus fraxineus]|uniref:Uncharacterized protein n=1 Tax=Hymenoscyphus fraxineus TaxID=746836 RepID=A0A9N9KPF8_9HELO|nr:hypothetical protein HYFRA_00004015 [Hymenoscyphus fraxineus]